MGTQKRHTQSPFHHKHDVGPVRMEAHPCRGCLTSPPTGQDQLCQGQLCHTGDIATCCQGPQGLSSEWPKQSRLPPSLLLWAAHSTVVGPHTKSLALRYGKGPRPWRPPHLECPPDLLPLAHS